MKAARYMKIKVAVALVTLMAMTVAWQITNVSNCRITELTSKCLQTNQSTHQDKACAGKHNNIKGSPSPLNYSSEIRDTVSKTEKHRLDERVKGTAGAAHDDKIESKASQKSKNVTMRAPQTKIFQKILQIAANDFNLTCSISVSMQKQRKFIKESKTPCYWEWVKGQKKLRCLPYFYLAGFPKCGTTDFYYHVKQHPQFVDSLKEFHWFNHLQFMKEYNNLDFYLNNLQNISNEVEKDFHTKGASLKIAGDLTPDYLCDNMRWRCLEGNEGLQSPKYTVAHTIKSLNPQAKFIVLLRDPVDRLYSRFRHMINVSPIFGKYWGFSNPENFHTAAMRAISLYTDCFSKSPKRQCVYNETLYHQAMLNDIGFYSVCLEDYWKLFPKENFLFLKFEDYTTSSKTFGKALKFLGMTPMTKSMEQNLNSTRVHGARYSPVLNETRMALKKFFRPFVHDLKPIVGEDLIKTWGY